MSAPSPAMREIAFVAVGKGVGLRAIARLVNAEGTTSLQAANVVRQLKTRKPTEETIAIYRRALGITAEHLGLACGKSIARTRIALWKGSLGAALDLDSSRWDLDATARFRAAVANNEEPFLDALREYALETLRDNCGAYGSGFDNQTDRGCVLMTKLGWYQPVVPEAVLAFRNAFASCLDIAALRRRPTGFDAALSSIFLTLRPIVSPERLNAAIEVVRALLLAEGYDLTHAEVDLRRSIESLKGHPF